LQELNPDSEKHIDLRRESHLSDSQFMNDSPPVKLYRDTFKFNLKIGFKLDIERTVTDLDLWKSVLTNWGYWKEGKWVKYSPLNVKGMISEYERRESAAKRSYDAAAVKPSQPASLRDAGKVGIPERSNGRVQRVWEGTGIQFRRSEKTLEEILTGALRTED
jgi:hypothetical protein